MAHRSNEDNKKKEYQLDENAYDVKNIRRQTKRKITKFKKENKQWEDS